MAACLSLVACTSRSVAAPTKEAKEARSCCKQQRYSCARAQGVGMPTACTDSLLNQQQLFDPFYCIDAQCATHTDMVQELKSIWEDDVNNIIEFVLKSR